MELLKLGSTGSDVKKWQYFLSGQKLFFGVVDGIFGPVTFEATKAFQKKYNLHPDGIVGNYTVGQAMSLGFGVVVDEGTEITRDSFPPKPSFKPLATNAERQQLFGTFKYVSDPLPKNPENIKITNGWDKENIVKVSIKQLIPIKGSDTVYFHKLGANQLVKLFNDWEEANLMHTVLTWEGSYVPRYVRGSKTVLSNHAFGTAFDINYMWNKLGAVPALVGQKGSVRKLVEIANNNGFYWGGHFSRRDGMHFEIAKLM